MSKTILIGSTNRLSNKTNKIVYLVASVLYMSFAGSRYYHQGFSTEMLFNVLMGAGFLIYGMVIFSPTPISPRVQISDSEIVTRTKLFGPTTKILWSDIESIRYASYEIEFHLKNGKETVFYTCNPEISLDIKRSIREFAEDKNIDISGG
ncbi:MAG: hypothetical protein JXR10_02580 [Cyclobacteriaceae bacterium]